MHRIRSFAVASLLAAGSLASAAPAAAQGTLVSGFGADQRVSFEAGFGVTAFNDLNAAAGQPFISFGALGSGWLVGANVRSNRIVDSGADGTFVLAFSQLLNGFSGEFVGSTGPLSLAFYNGGSLVGRYSTSLSSTTPQFVGVSGLNFNLVQVSGAFASWLAADNLLVGKGGALRVSAVPEPGTLGLLGLGLSGLALAARRRKASSRA